jgi:hypothetical protein
MSVAITPTVGGGSESAIHVHIMRRRGSNSGLDKTTTVEIRSGREGTRGRGAPRGSWSGGGGKLSPRIPGALGA